MRWRGRVSTPSRFDRFFPDINDFKVKKNSDTFFYEQYLTLYESNNFFDNDNKIEKHESTW